ncbi:MAG: MFS transporter [Actinomycetota bacterium]|nr:MFS transporter [Actinomycetota bacterium]MDQ2957730.1 MFS transporter [Actinomycetota bacterium]
MTLVELQAAGNPPIPAEALALTGEIVLTHPIEQSPLRRLVGRGDFRRLLSVRMFGQFADGVFQASLAGTILFNPERQAHAGDIAAGFAVLLLPYSVLGPFAGVLLDRWSRQRVLLGANLLRALLVCGVAAEIGAGVHGQPFYLSALVVISVNRFILSALSASLPHVVEPEQLINANAISVTAGAVIAAFGGGSAIGIRVLFGDHNSSYAIVALGAALFYTLAGGCSIRFATRQLGPDDETRNHSESVRNVLTGMADGVRHIRSHPSVLRAFTVIGIHRFAYGITAICTLLLYRNYFTDDGVLRAGLAGLGQIVAAIALGGGVAALITPYAARRIGYTRWPAVLLIGAGVVELVLGLPFRMATFLPAAALLGLAAQGVKICVDTLTAQRVADDYRGRVFSIYDTLFNVVFVAAGVLTALVLPENGKSVIAVVVIALAYLLTGAVYYFAPDDDLAVPACDLELNRSP